MGSPETTPPPTEAPQEDGFRRLLQVSSHLSSASMITAGIVGGWAMARYGPALAMGLAILGANTEPTPPALSYPWLLWALCVAAWATGFTLGQREASLRAALLEHGGAGASAVLPVVHLLRLWGRT